LYRRETLIAAVIAALAVTLCQASFAEDVNRSGQDRLENAAQAAADPARAYLEQAWHHFQAARWDSAIAASAAVIRLDPTDERGYRDIMRSYIAEDKLWEAFRTFEALGKLHPFRAAPHAAMGEVELLRDRPERAQAHFEKAVQRDPLHQPGLAGLARAFVAQGKGELAIDYFDKLLAARPTEAAYRYGKAVALAEIGDGTGAATQFKWAIRLDPSSWLAERDYARTLAATGSWELAAAHFERAIEIVKATGDRITAGALAGELEEVMRHRTAVSDDER
jgi:tetratricopeptide (TPR) repeat protein